MIYGSGRAETPAVCAEGFASVGLTMPARGAFGIGYQIVLRFSGLCWHMQGGRGGPRQRSQSFATVDPFPNMASAPTQGWSPQAVPSPAHPVPPTTHTRVATAGGAGFASAAAARSRRQFESTPASSRYQRFLGDLHKDG